MAGDCTRSLIAGHDLLNPRSVAALVLRSLFLRSRRFCVPDSPELFSAGFYKLLMPTQVKFAKSVPFLATELPHELCRKRQRQKALLMDDTLQWNRWQELAERTSLENDPARLMKLVDELLAELHRLKEKTPDSTARSV
jgi:hypothetical protein